ncbi:hypothetical protein KQ910_12565 [Reyranella sp. MMS21-HV4-11]|uniref:Lipoprotein n=1 Tax=Reyranella humidisoli TaxID=2849149 RepID=A0ABS6IJ28_9HYPH|nr:hypothetical protein [Reyranella sp. MMS21-HV4-11]MBU8874599.1 hypothetical protein [Reyranella sp. MMS21-HV4-11]
MPRISVGRASLNLMPVRLALVAGLGLALAACQGDGYGAPSGAYPAAPGYYNTNYAPPPAPRYGYAQPAPNYYYGNQPQQNVRYNQADGRRYTSVTVVNRGQNGYRDDVVQQQVVCGSQYYDGYRTRTAPRC